MTRVPGGDWVSCSLHAAYRALERVPAFDGMVLAQATAWVEYQAGLALRDGRKARRCPRWCVREDEEGWKRRGKAKREGTARYVWDEAESVAMLVKRLKDENQEDRWFWLVITVVAPTLDLTAAAV